MEAGCSLSRRASELKLERSASGISGGCQLITMREVTTKLVWAWEDSCELRDRVRLYSRFVLVAGHDGCGQAPGERGSVIPKSVGNVRVNKVALLPICEWMSCQEGLKMPTIDFFLESVAKHYIKHRLEADSMQIYQEAWGLRRLTQLVKSRLWKPKPPAKDILTHAPLSCRMLRLIAGYDNVSIFQPSSQDPALIELLTALLASSQEESGFCRALSKSC